MVERDSRPMNAMTTHPLLIFPLERPAARERSAKPFTREDRKPPVLFPGVRYAFTAAPREVLRPVDCPAASGESADLVETGRCSNGDRCPLSAPPNRPHAELTERGRLTHP